MLSVASVHTAEAASILALVISAGTLIVAMRRSSHERKLADLQDARGTLAAGALALGQTKTKLRECYGSFNGPLADLSERWPEDTGSRLSELQDELEDLEAAVAALRIRFDAEHAVVTEAASALEDTRSILILYVRGPGRAFNQNRARDAEEDGEKAWTLSESYDKHKDAYLSAAQKAAGVNL
jgi:hypothetical protein